MSEDAVFRAVADGTRRSIVVLLNEGGALPVQEIAKHFKMSRQAVSKHLSVLEGAKLVQTRKKGRESIYSANTKALSKIQTWLANFGYEATEKAAPKNDLDAYLDL